MAHAHEYKIGRRVPSHGRSLRLRFALVGKPLLNPAVLPIGIGVAILSGAFPYSLEMIGLKHLPVHTFGVLMSVEPARGACQRPRVRLRFPRALAHS